MILRVAMGILALAVGIAVEAGASRCDCNRKMGQCSARVDPSGRSLTFRSSSKKCSMISYQVNGMTRTPQTIVDGEEVVPWNGATQVKTAVATDCDVCFDENYDGTQALNLLGTWQCNGAERHTDVCQQSTKTTGTFVIRERKGGSELSGEENMLKEVTLGNPRCGFKPGTSPTYNYSGAISVRLLGDNKVSVTDYAKVQTSEGGTSIFTLAGSTMSARGEESGGHGAYWFNCTKTTPMLPPS